MFRFSLHILFLSWFALSVNAQDQLFESVESAYTFVDSISIQAESISSDRLKNVYIIDEKGAVYKFNEQGKQLGKFTEFSLGTPSHIDATNPFRILLYYPDFMTVVTLDNTFNKVGEAELFDLDYNNIEALCFSNDGNIWLYDPTTFRVQKMNHQSKILLEGNELSFIFDEALQPNFMLERHNWLYLNDPEKGVLVFDLYGQYVKEIPVKGLRDFQVYDDRLIYLKDGNLEFFDLKALRFSRVSLPKIRDIRFLKIEKNKLIIAGETSVSFYQF